VQIRKLELLVSLLVFVMAGCFFGELSYVKPPAAEVVKGLFVPKLKGDGATADAIALVGALVMPWVTDLALMLINKYRSHFSYFWQIYIMRNTCYALMIGTTFSCTQHWCFQGKRLSPWKESMYVKATNTTSISRL